MVTQTDIRNTAGNQIIFVVPSPIGGENVIAVYTYNPKTDTVKYSEHRDGEESFEDEYDVKTATEYINGLLKRAHNISRNFQKPTKMKGHSHRAPQKKCKLVCPEKMF